MTMIGIYRIELAPGASEEAFVKHMRENVFTKGDALPATRITRGFAHELLRVEGDAPRYAWKAEVDLMTDRPYTFPQPESIQEHVKDFGKPTGLDVYRHAA